MDRPDVLKDLRNCLHMDRPDVLRDLRNCLHMDRPNMLRDLRNCLPMDRPNMLRDLRNSLPMDRSEHHGSDRLKETGAEKGSGRRSAVESGNDLCSTRPMCTVLRATLGDS